MKALHFRQVVVFLVGLFMVTIPALAQGQSGDAKGGPPPVAPPIVREGDFAVRLVSAYDLGTTSDEIEAETLLGRVGIVPRNGWIADYPVTPDIVGELRKAAGGAADSKNLPMTRDEALKTFDRVTDEVGSRIRPYAGEKPPDTSVAENYPDPAVMDDYYAEQGPPVVTYYTPPSNYSYLYGWVPYPFFSFGFFHRGFFILHDFHRVVRVRNRTVFVSNHFNSVENHRVFRVDPMARSHGTTYGGIAAPHTEHFISTGIPGSETRIFNAPHTDGVSGGRMDGHGGGSHGGGGHGGGGHDGGGRGGGGHGK